MSGPVFLRHLQTEAGSWRYDGTNAIDIAHWLDGQGYISADGELVIHTMQGDIVAEVGNTVIVSAEAGSYPITPEVRAACWEEIA
jgi:hypothetical protein